MTPSSMALSIALFTYSTQPRGSVVHTLELATALTELGHPVCVYALDKDGQGFGRSLPFSVCPVPAAPAPPLDGSEGMDALIRQRIQEFVDFLSLFPPNHDIYHAQDCISANALVILRQMGRIPQVVRTVHHVEDYVSPYLQHCQDRSIRDPDLCLCVSDRWQQTLNAEYGLDAPRVLNGVNLTRFSASPSGDEEALKQRYGFTGSPRYLTVGGIEPRKNSLQLLDAFAEVLTVHPAAQLLIAGGATLFDYRAYREEFFQRAKALNIEVGRSLLLPGVIPDAELPTLYRCADAFCFPSTKEGWGLVVLEAIASGLPVIVSDQPPFTEFLNSDQALLVNPESPGAIAQAMLDVLDEPLAQMRILSSQAVLSRYTWQQSAQRHIEHYQMLMRAALWL